MISYMHVPYFTYPFRYVHLDYFQFFIIIYSAIMNIYECLFEHICISLGQCFSDFFVR